MLDNFMTTGIQKDIDGMVLRPNVHGMFAFALTGRHT